MWKLTIIEWLIVGGVGWAVGHWGIRPIINWAIEKYHSVRS